MKHPMEKKRKWLLWVFILLLVTLVLFFTWPGLSQKVSEWASGKEDGKMNQIEQERISGFEEIADKVVVKKNITYSKRYGKRKLDVYMPKAQYKTPKPTIFWAHGGAFIAGDKKSVADYSTMLASQGYVVVNINYSLAPEYEYPTPVLQIGDAYQYIAAHQKRYGIDLNRIAFGGDSAGGQIMGQFVNIQVDPDYAKMVEIDPVVSNSDTIKAVVFFSALLDINQYDENENEYANEVFDKSAQAYFGLEEWKGTDKVNRANIVGNVTAKYPPTYLTDGNTASFQPQAEELEEQLKKEDVLVTSTYFPREQAELRHQYQFRLSLKEAVENYEQVSAFLSEYLNKDNGNSVP